MARKSRETRRTSTSPGEPAAAGGGRGGASSSSRKDPVTQWAADVVDGRIVQGPHVRNAARRHLDDLEKGPKRGLYWDLDAALRVIQFFPDVLRLNGGQFEGLPFHLHPSQQFRIGSLFGWKREDTGARRFRRFYDEEGKGNGKTPMLAGIGLYCLMFDKEARAEVYAAGSLKDQAMVLFRDAVAMRDLSPSLSSRLIPSGTNPVWNLAHLESGSFFKPISSDAGRGKSGPRPSCALCDEVHEHKDSRIIVMLERGFKFRRQPLLGMATNSGSNRQSVCWQEHVHAVRVAAGNPHAEKDPEYLGEIIDDTQFSFVCALDKGDDPLTQPGCWPKANPLHGYTVTDDYLAAQAKQAVMIPGRMNEILRLHFCQWTDADEAWMTRPTLEQVLADFEPESEHAGREVIAGLDLSSNRDLTAAAFVVKTGTVQRELAEKDGTKSTVELPTFDAWVECWTPKEKLSERAVKDEAPYEDWVRDGWLNAVPGPVVRMDFVAARLAGVASTFDLARIAYDRYGFKRNFEPELDNFGITAPTVAHPQAGAKRAQPNEDEVEAAKAAGQPPPQGLWMPGSLNDLEEAILDRRIRIRASPPTISALMSVVTEKDAMGNRWLSKRKATNRIDAAVALCMAFGAASAHHLAAKAGRSGRSFWDQAESTQDQPGA